MKEVDLEKSVYGIFGKLAIELRLEEEKGYSKSQERFRELSNKFL